MHAAAPDEPILRVAAMVGRFGLANGHPRRGWRPPARIRLAQRLAAGLTPQQAAAAQGSDAGEVAALLEQPDFAALVASYRSLAEAPEAEQTARLVKLARIAIENALGGLDMAAGFFVLRENARGRDPAVTLARGVRAAAARRTEPTVPTPTGAVRSPSMPRDPGLQLINRGAARLRAGLVAEHAARDFATAPEPPRATTQDAARRALALKAAAMRGSTAIAIRQASPCDVPDASPSRGAPAVDPGTTRVASLPRRPRAP